MTNEELKKYYSGLLIIQYITKTKAKGMIESIAEQFIADQIYTQVQDAFDIDTAVGVQLDVVGKYAGVQRNTSDLSGPISLDDDDFRSLIKVAIVKNNSGSSLYDIENLLNVFFPGSFLVFDYKNMQMSYVFDVTIGSRQLAEAFVKNGLLPKPMGVAASLIYAPNIKNFFGFRTYAFAAQNVRGFNTYEEYHEDWPWLKYDDAIIP